MSQDTKRRIAVLLEYDGSNYAGSQFQVNARTIQRELEAAIHETTGEQVRVMFAGRTDAGVHAYGQVAAFDTTTTLAPETILRALNARLPRDIEVRAAATVDSGFDPRRNAVRRHYRYVIENRGVRPVIGRQYAWHVSSTLDIGAMSAAASSLVGEHDFAAFGGIPEESGASTVRRVERFDVRREGTKVVQDVVANAFLRGMVRRMAGALVQVGQDKLSVGAYSALLRGAPASAGPAAPPHGLFLVRVEYDIDPFGR